MMEYILYIFYIGNNDYSIETKCIFFVTFHMNRKDIKDAEYMLWINSIKVIQNQNTFLFMFQSFNVLAKKKANIIRCNLLFLSYIYDKFFNSIIWFILTSFKSLMNFLISNIPILHRPTEYRE